MKDIVILRSKKCNRALLEEVIDALKAKDINVVEEIFTSSLDIKKDTNYIIYINELNTISKYEKELILLAADFRKANILPCVIADSLYENTSSLVYVSTLTNINSQFCPWEWNGKTEYILVSQEQLQKTKKNSATLVVDKIIQTYQLVNEEKTHLEKTQKIPIEKTPRGFSIFNFKDSYGCDCSIQESSAASEPKIWFGIDNAKITTKDGAPVGSENMTAFSRMHLSQEQVKELLPLLENFVKTGNLN